MQSIIRLTFQVAYRENTEQTVNKLVSVLMEDFAVILLEVVHVLQVLLGQNVKFRAPRIDTVKGASFILYFIIFIENTFCLDASF